MFRHFLTGAALVAAMLSGCSGQRDGNAVATYEDACEAAMEAVIGRGDYRQSQIAGCEDRDKAVANGGYYQVHLKGHCREPVCGSTSLGWFLVEERSGRVFEMDYEDWKPGAEILPTG